MQEKPDVTLTVRLPRQLATQLDRTTIAYDLTPGEVVRRALDDYLERLDRISVATERNGSFVPDQLTQ